MSLRVTVVRAWPHRHDQRDVQLANGGTVADALAAVGWLPDAEHPGVAVHGLRAKPGQPLQDGDRVELLRPLQLDPKQARRLRAQRARERQSTRAE